MGAKRKYLSDIASRKNRYDVKYNSEVINKITKKLMVDGKYSIIYRFMCQSLEEVKNEYLNKNTDISTALAKEELTEQEVVSGMVDKIIQRVSPRVELVSKRQGGANVQLPVVVSEERSKLLGLNFLVNAIKSRGERTIHGKIKGEMLDIIQDRGQSKAVVMMNNLLKQARANAVFSKHTTIRDEIKEV
ncbi:MAG: hypothetical protein ACON5A_03955 [Candidatus Comchoanobacterales bacterium]